MAIQDSDAGTPLAVAVAGGIATISLNRPSKRNALTHAMWHDLTGAVRAVQEEDSARVLILAGAGEHFSAGADIGEFDDVRRDAETARAYESANVEAFAALREARLPTIAAIRGACIGGGFGLAAACDLRIAAPDAFFAVPAARLGLAYPHAAMRDIVHAVGPQTARYLILSAARIDASAAREAGFLLEIVPEGELEARVREVAQAIAANAPLSISAARLAIAAVLSGDEDAERRARLAGDLTFDSADYAEGRAAFREKRPPRFTGR